MKMLLNLAVAVAMLSGASAQEVATPPAPKKATITVLQALNISSALRQLGTYQDGSGKRVEVPFKFSGSMLMAMALNIDAGDQVQKAYTSAYSKYQDQELKGVKPEDMDKKRVELANSDAAKKMLDQPASVSFVEMDPKGLCMEEPPVEPCRVTNAIPPTLLAALVPILKK